MTSNNSNIKKLESGRAEQAYKDAEFAAQKGGFNDKVKKAFRAHAKYIPMMIKTNGLGATLAFMKSKAKSEKEKEKREFSYTILYEKISHWLKSVDRNYLLGEHKDKDLIEAVVSMNSQEYRALTIEVLAYFGWLRRFAEGLIEGEE